MFKSRSNLRVVHRAQLLVLAQDSRQLAHLLGAGAHVGFGICGPATEVRVRAFVALLSWVHGLESILVSLAIDIPFNQWIPHLFQLVSWQHQLGLLVLGKLGSSKGLARLCTPNSVLALIINGH